MSRAAPDHWRDRVLLADLAARYCRGVDRRDFELVRSLYHDDAVDRHGAMFEGGPDEFVAWLPELMAAFELTVHRLGQSVFAIAGDDAEGEHYVTAYHRTHLPQRQEITINGRYLDRYRRADGVWKFAERRLVFDYGETRALNEDGFEMVNADAPNGTADRSDPSWDMPLLAALGISGT